MQSNLGPQQGFQIPDDSGPRDIRSATPSVWFGKFFVSNRGLLGESS